MSSTAESSIQERDQRISQILAFIGTYAVLLYYALRGGSYDVVIRQEEAIAVWWVLGLGWAVGVLPRYRRPRGSRLPLLAFLGLIAWTALSLSWTGSESRTLAELARDLHYLGLVVLVWSVFGADTWRAAAAGLIAGAVTVTALSLASRLTPGLFPGNRIKGVFGTNRLNYPFNYWNAVSAWAAMTIALTLAMGSHAARSWVRALCLAAVPLCGVTAYLTYARQSVLGIGVALLVVFVLSRNRWTVALNALAAAAGAAIAILAARDQPAIVNATSGAGGGKVVTAVLIGCALAAAVAVVGQRVKIDSVRLPRHVSQIVLAPGALTVLVIALTVARPAISDAWDEFRNVKTASGTSADPAARFTNLNGARYAHWTSAVRAFKADPVNGVGAGAWEFWYSRDGGNEFVRDAHSLYFENLAELGFVGLALVLVLLVGLLYVALRRRRHIHDVSAIGMHVALTSAFVVFLAHAAVDWVWETTAISFLALVGIALTAHRRRRTRPPGRMRRGFSDIEKRKRLAARRRWYAGRIGMPVFALVAILIQIPNLASTSSLRKSQASFQSGDVARAATQANDAIDAAPWASEGFMQRGLIFEAQDRLKDAAADMRTAADREPLNWRPRLLLSRIEAERGDVRAALRAYNEFKRLRPKSIYRIPGA